MCLQIDPSLENKRIQWKNVYRFSTESISEIQYVEQSNSSYLQFTGKIFYSLCFELPIITLFTQSSS